MQESVAQAIYTKNGITKEAIFGDRKIIHLGCGDSKLLGTVGIDRVALPSVDIVHDLDTMPWPLEVGSVDIFFAHSIVEHVDSLIDFLNEVWRAGKNGSRLIIAVPYFRSTDSFSDPTHKHFFTSQSLDYFLTTTNKLSAYKYTEHTFREIGFWYGWPQSSQNIMVRWFKHWAHRHAKFYDQYLSLLFPMKILVWELEIVKKT
jgi:SAM-dependent methyltransferase